MTKPKATPSCKKMKVRDKGCGTDSTISICWTVYEKVRLHVFHRLRVSNIRNKIDITELYHVVGKQMIADTGTRPDLLKPEHILPGSDWCEGKDWMKLSIEDALRSGAIKSVRDIKMDNEAKKAFKEGVIQDSSLNVASKESKVSISSKVLEREKFSNYLISPLLWSYPRFVRIQGWVFLAIYKWKYKMVLAREARNLPVSDGSKSEDFKLKPPKFSAFNVTVDENNSSVTQITLSNIFGTSYGLNLNIAFLAQTTIVHVRLTDMFLSLSLEYIYRKASAEVIHFNDKKFVHKIGEQVDGILYCKSRIQEGQNLQVIGGLEDFIDLKSFTGIEFKVPIIDYYSPLALSIANHLHFNVVKHRGAETTYRISLQHVKILGGRSLLKLIRDECIYCQKLLLKYTKQLMSPLREPQLSISPIFYYAFADAWGPLKAFAPGYEKSTRASSKTYDVYMLVIGCAATGMINCQVVEGGKKAANVLDALNRFFDETCVPKIFFIDKDGALIKSLQEGEMELLLRNETISKERGILFETCSAQAHNAHGRIERRILMVQEAFERSEFKKFRLHGLGWQTVAKKVEHEVNSIPLGFLTHREDNAPILRILTPNFLKLNAAANRSPSTLFNIPTCSNDLMSRVQDAYKLWYLVWSDAYIPLLAKRSKWHDEDENLKENDVIYFKIKDSVLSSKWLIGKVETPIFSPDGKVRKVLVSYKFDTEQGTREFRTVERPVRECVKLWNIEDTTLFEEIEQVRNASKEILGYSFDEEYCNTIMDLNDAQVQSTLNTIYSCSVSACNQNGSSISDEAGAMNFGVYKAEEEDLGEHCVNSEIGRVEREMRVDNENNDEYFMINFNDFESSDNDYIELL